MLRKRLCFFTQCRGKYNFKQVTNHKGIELHIRTTVFTKRYRNFSKVRVHEMDRKHECNADDGMKRNGDIWKLDKCTTCECKASYLWIYYFPKICYFIGEFPKFCDLTLFQIDQIWCSVEEGCKKATA